MTALTRAGNYIREAMPKSRLGRWALYSVFGASALLLTAEFTVARMNLSLVTTTCVPLGLYQTEGNPYPLHNGELVQVLLPDNTGNPAIAEALKYHWIIKGQPWIKYIAALPGQTVILKPQGVWVDGKYLPNSRIRHWTPGHTHRIAHYPYGTYHLKTGQVWLYAPGNYAFDSAYYGPVSEQNILQKARPFWVIPGSQYWLKKGD